MIVESKEAIQPVDRSERLKTAFLSLSDESQTFMLGQAEGLRVAQTLLPGQLPAHGSSAQERRQRPDAGDRESRACFAGDVYRKS
jgi:hypothetical protein